MIGHSDYSPSITAHNWTVSDHQWSKALKLQIDFTLRMRNCVSSSWFERLWISDRKFVNHTAEMILWSMILEVAFWAVDINRRQPRQLVLMEFCSASLERGWAMIVGTFRFCFGATWLKKPSIWLLHKLRAVGFRSNHQSRWKSRMPTPSVLSFVFSRFPNKHVRAFFCFLKWHRTPPWI